MRALARAGYVAVLVICILSLGVWAQEANPVPAPSDPPPVVQPDSPAPPIPQVSPESSTPPAEASPMPPPPAPEEKTEPMPTQPERAPDQEPDPDDPDAKPTPPPPPPDAHEGVPPPASEESEPGSAGITGAATAAGNATAAHIPARYDVNHIGDRGVGKGINFYSFGREVAMGRQLADEIDAAVNLVKDPEVGEYVNRLAQSLVRNSDAQVPFTVKVIDDDEINAFALPGGFFYVNSGLVLAAENEAELVGVMAHEIAHVAARHATRNATKMQIFNMAALPLIFATGPAGLLARQAMSIAMPLSFLKFSRDAEREADLLGLQYTYAAGYDPAEFVHFFETLRTVEKEKATRLSKAFSTHPLTRDRIYRAQREIQLMLPARSEYIVSTSDFDQIRRRLAVLNAARQGDFSSNGGPVLRRRLGHDTGTTGDPNSTDESSDKPTLRRR